MSFTELYSIDNEQVSEIQTWSTFNKKVIKFQNGATSELFQLLFGADGARLFRHFVVDCNRDITIFRTYLIVNQNNLLLVHIVKIKL